VKIVIDAMGGDFAPLVVVEGVCEASKLYSDTEFILVGDTIKIKECLKLKKIELPSTVELYHCSEVVGMNESPVSAIRKKKDSSVLVAVELVKEGKADALVTAGNTGAAVAATTLKWRMLEGIDRPGIALPLPNSENVSVLLDVGANILCRPIHYLQYAIMGKVYSEYILKKKNNRIGLLNVGEEEGKGGEDMILAHNMLKENCQGFIGNVEGRDIYNGKCDVIVCDGFVGNIVLKVSEGLIETLMAFTKKALKSNLISFFGAMLSKSAFSKLKKNLDYSEYGGAPLLGVNGICIISHGGSSAKAIKSAIRVAREFIKDNVNQHIIEEIRDCHGKQ
jgi:phosphate acyltransferase